MRHIKKNPEPSKFVEWKKDNAAILQEKYKKKEQYDKKESTEKESGDTIWTWFGQDFPVVRDDLRKALLKEQGHICCYCGQDISDIPTAIEHFKPKSKDTENRIFDYQNLLISCKCSESLSPSKIQFKETVGYTNLKTTNQIADKAGCSSRKLRTWNIGLPQDPRKDIEMDIGTDVYLYIKHCDDKKENIEPENKIISPLDSDCIKYFEYNEDGTIKVIYTTEDISKNILDDVLNLNAANLCAFRVDAYGKAEALKKRLVAEFDSGTITEDELIDEIEVQDEPDENGKRTPFCFVFTYLLNQIA